MTPVIARLRVIGLLAVFSAAFSTLLGCAYSVEVRNTTDRPVSVRMTQVNADGFDWLLDSDRVQPGQVATLGPSEAFFSSVFLEVDATNEETFTTRRELRNGRSAYDVFEDFDDNEVILRLVPREPDDPQRLERDPSRTRASTPGPATQAPAE